MFGSSLRVSDDINFFFSFLSTNCHFTDSRRAVFHIGTNLYSAKLVDLPCIVESQKTLDGKQMFKVADICQVIVSFPFARIPLCIETGYRC